MDEPVPGFGASVEDFIVAVPHCRGEFVGAQKFPDVLHWVEFGRIGRQGHENDVVGQFERASALMPAGAVADQRGDGAGRDLGADLGQMKAHAFGVDSRQDERGADAARRADGPEYVGVGVAIVANPLRA